MLHQHRHHHVDQHKLRRQHERHKVEGGDELQPRVAAVVAARAARRALPQGVLGGGGAAGERRREKKGIWVSAGEL